MNMISKKMITIAALLLAVESQAIAHWTAVPYPAAAMAAGAALKDCDVDSHGTIWYTLVNGAGNAYGGGVFSQSSDTTASPVNYASIPADVSSYRSGIYVDKSDSVFVSGTKGEVYAGENGVFHALPSIPLLYSFINPGTGDPVPKNNVGGLIKDSKGHLVAATDSLAWWFDGTQWNPIGTWTQYPNHRGGGQTDHVYQHPNGNLWVLTGGSVTEISPDLQIVDTITGDGGETASFGPDGSAWGGQFGCSWLYVRHSPSYTLDTINVKYPTFGQCVAMAGAAYADNDGWVWASTGSVHMPILHGDTIKYFMDTPLIDLVWKFLLAPDSSFWMCSSKTGLLKYSEKYSIPAEAKGGAAVVWPVETVTSRMDISVSSGVLQLLPQGAWRVTVADVRGGIAWSGFASSSTTVPLGSGSWIISAIGPQGQTLRKMIAIVR